MQKPKFRLFGGPNGSGKTYVFTKFKSLGFIHTEMYINADRIEVQIKKSHRFSFNAYRVKVSGEEFTQYVLQSGLYGKVKDSSFVDNISIRSGILKISNDLLINSYHASFIASFLAHKLLATRQSFAFETVMSHQSKIELLQRAKEAGYKTYLYFIFTDSIDINITRVLLRVKQGEHYVKEDLIKSRSFRTFALLPSAFALADTAYVIDNSNDTKAIFSKENNIIIKQSGDLPEIIKASITEIINSHQ